MIWTIALILIVLWLLGFSFKLGGALIHLLLAFAIIAIVYRLVTGRSITR